MNIDRAYQQAGIRRAVGRRRALGMAGAFSGAAALAVACGGGAKQTSETGSSAEPALRRKEAEVAAGEQPKSGGVGRYVTSGEPPDLDWWAGLSLPDVACVAVGGRDDMLNS